MVRHPISRQVTISTIAILDPFRRFVIAYPEVAGPNGRKPVFAAFFRRHGLGGGV